jgi:hypothetical protein
MNQTNLVDILQEIAKQSEIIAIDSDEAQFNRKRYDTVEDRELYRAGKLGAITARAAIIKRLAQIEIAELGGKAHQND